MASALSHDLRYGLRMLAKSPGSTALAIVALALGIGANTAVFSFADLLLRRPVALPELNRLVSVGERSPDGSADDRMSPANYLDLRNQNKSLENLAAYQYWPTDMTGNDAPQAVQGVRITPDFFPTLRMNPTMGRNILPDEQQPGKNNVAVLSAAFWQGRLASDPFILGKAIELDGTKYTVVGVMPHYFSFPLGAPDLWVPLAMDAPERSLRDKRTLRALGRLKSGVSLDEARAEYAGSWRQLQELYPSSNGGTEMSVIELREQIIGDSGRGLIIFLVGAVGFVLLIACANVANLQLAKSAGRQREVAVRAALGASRWRVIRQLLAESVLLSALGAAAGVLLAVWGVDLLRSSLPADLVKWVGDWYSLSVDRTALAFTLVLAVLAGIFSGLAPAWQTSRVDLNNALKEATSRSATGRSHRLRNLFVVAEFALALSLMVGTGLMARGLASLLSEQPRLEPAQLLTLRLSPPESRFEDPANLRAYYKRVLEEVRTLPGVQSAAVARGLPYTFYDGSVAVNVEGRPTPPPGQAPTALPESTTPGYFRTMRIAVLHGRDFSPSDSPDTMPVAIVSDTMARRLWPQQDPLGKRLKITSDAPGSGKWLTVVGVVADIRNDAFEHAYLPVLYQPYEQAPARSADLVVRTDGDPIALAGAVLARVLLVDKTPPQEPAESLLKQMNDQLIGLRYVAVFMAIFGVIALALSAVGVYGVMAHSVTERTHEVGLRMALGATSSRVLGTVMASGMKLAAIGVGFGVVGSLALARLLGSVIYGVSAWDPATFAGVPLLLFLVALIACYVPARKATGLNPMVALRHE